VRVWDLHPELLCRKHLLGQHLEVHSMLSVIDAGPGTGWWSHPETQRFVEEPDWLRLVHEVTRMEMDLRWERHAQWQHKTPVLIKDPDFVDLADDAFSLDGWSYLPFLVAAGYPVTRLEDKTPWERDGITQREYIQSRETYVRSAHGRQEEGQDPDAAVVDRRGGARSHERGPDGRERPAPQAPRAPRRARADQAR
jgi:hypothetical protein